MTSAPAGSMSHSKSTPVASSTRRVASVSSGPVPSPGISVTRCVTRERLYGRCRRALAPMCRHSVRGSPGGCGSVLLVSEFRPGLEGVIAFETEIAEPDKEGSALRYRGVDIEEIVGRIPFEKVWGLLIDGSYDPGLPPAEPVNI